MRSHYNTSRKADRAMWAAASEAEAQLDIALVMLGREEYNRHGNTNHGDKATLAASRLAKTVAEQAIIIKELRKQLAHMEHRWPEWNGCCTGCLNGMREDDDTIGFTTYRMDGELCNDLLCESCAAAVADDQ